MRRFQTAAILRKLKEFKLADIGEGNAEAQLLKWNISVGDIVKEFQNICEVQSDKVTTEISSSLAGRVTKLHYNVGDMARVYTPLITVDTVDDLIVPDATVVHVESPVAIQTEHTINDKPLAIPSVRHLARMHNLDLSHTTGTGKDGRILKSDIMDQIKGQSGTLLTSNQTEINASARIDPQKNRLIKNKEVISEENVNSTTRQLSIVERAMYKSMTKANMIPHFGYSDDIDVTNILELKTSYLMKESNGTMKLTLLPFFCKAVSMALNRFPLVNSHLIENEDLTEVRVRSFKHHNIGFAMDTPMGLFVPNIKNVESKSIYEIKTEIEAIQRIGAKGKLSKEYLEAGTITLSNIGSLGGTIVRPILMPPQVAICGIGKAQKVLKLDSKGVPCERQILTFNWSGDHRVLDGATIARFNNLVKRYLEHPEIMLIDSK